MERLILARHAESVFNVRGVLNGDPSIPGGLTAVAGDVFRLWSWETSGRPLLFGVDRRD